MADSSELRQIVVFPPDQADTWKALLRCVADVPVLTNAWQVTREYAADEWARMLAAVGGAMSPVHWALYYAYWFHVADMCACYTTTHLTQNRLEKVVQMKLDAAGFLCQLPKTCGSLMLDSGSGATVLRVTVIRTGNYDVKPEYKVECTPVEVVSCDWPAFVRAIPALRHLHTTKHEELDAAIDDAVAAFQLASV